MTKTILLTILGAIIRALCALFGSKCCNRGKEETDEASQD